MVLKKVFICIACCCLFFITSCSKSESENKDNQTVLTAEAEAAEAERLAAEEAKAKAKAEADAKKTAELAEAEAERQKELGILNSSPLEDIINNNDIDFRLESEKTYIGDLHNKKGIWSCTYPDNIHKPVYISSEIIDNSLTVYVSGEVMEYKQLKNGEDFDYNLPSYPQYSFSNTYKFTVTKQQLIDYMTMDNYELPKVVDCDTYDDSIQYFNPVNEVKAVIVSDFTNVREAPRGEGESNIISKQ